MKYPDTLKLYFIKPKHEKRNIQKRIKQIQDTLGNFESVIITHSFRHGAGIEYSLRDIAHWATGELIFDLCRKDEDVIPDNLKKDE